MSESAYCPKHGPLPEGHRFCEYCSEEGSQRGVSDTAEPRGLEQSEMLDKSPATLGVEPSYLDSNAPAISSLGEIEYRAQEVRPGCPWTLGVRMPMAMLQSHGTAEVRVAGQRQEFQLFGRSDCFQPFRPLETGSYSMHFEVRHSGRKLCGDGAVLVDHRVDQPSIHISGTGNMLNQTLGGGAVRDSWTRCPLRPHPHDALNLGPRSRRSPEPHFMSMSLPSGRVVRLVRGDRTIVGRGSQSNVDLARFARSKDEVELLPNAISRQAIELAFCAPRKCLIIKVLNGRGARRNGKKIEQGDSFEIPLSELWSEYKIDFAVPHDISLGVREIRALSGLGHVHRPWPNHAQDAHDANLGGLELTLTLFGARHQVIWVLDAVAAHHLDRDLSKSFIIFDQGDALYLLETTAASGSWARAKAHPFELGGQVPLPSGVVKIDAWGSGGLS